MPVAPQYKKSSKALFPFRKKSSSYKRRRYAKKSSRKGMSTALIKSVVNRQLGKDMEMKLKSLRAVNQATPIAQATTGTASNIVWYRNYVLGQGPSDQWIGPAGTYNYVDLEGFNWPQGAGQQQRIGRYLNFKHITVNLRIACNNISSVSCPIRFRVIVYKSKRKFGNTDAVGSNPNTNLFLNTTGGELGLNNSYTGDSVSMEFMNMLTNKRSYDIHTDTQFILSPHTFSVQGGSNIVSPLSPGYPAEKNLLLKLPHNSKVSFENTTNNPEDLNYQYAMTILSMPYGDNTQVSANAWKSNVRGTVCVTDA